MWSSSYVHLSISNGARIRRTLVTYCKINFKAAANSHSGISNTTNSISGGCQITMTRFDGLNLLSAGDVIYPPVDDPYAVGKAACAHCLSALYACGVSEVISR